jgi:transposase
MAKKRKHSLPAKDIREILRLGLECGFSNREIAKSSSVSHVSAGFYLKQAIESGRAYEDFRKMNDQELIACFRDHHGSDKSGLKPEPDWNWVHQELSRKGVTLQLLWEEYKDEHPDGYQTTQFYERYRRWKSKLHTWMRQDHKAGEKLFVDYAGQTVEIKDPQTGKFRKAQVFVAVLGLSNYTYAEATWDQSSSSWIGSHIRAFEYFQGVPKVIIPDNLKAAVIKANRYESQINPTYLNLAIHYSTAIMPARVRKPKDKAKAEVGVQIVERWILAALRNHTFFSLRELNNEIRRLLIKLNEKPFKKLDGTRQMQFDMLEKPVLAPLPVDRFEICEWKNAKVNLDYHIELNRHYYSVPYKLVHQVLNVRFTDTTVEIFHQNERIASHRRSLVPHHHTTVREHMPKAHQEHLEWTPSRMQEWASNIGDSTVGVINEILKSRNFPEQSYRSCLGVLRLSKKYGNQRLETACKRALSYDMPRYSNIRNILEKGLDLILEDQHQKESQPPQDHPNLRGGNYYQSTLLN